MQTIETENFVLNIDNDPLYTFPRLDGEYLFTIYTMNDKFQGDDVLSNKFNIDEVFDENRNLKTSFTDKYYAKIIYFYSHSGFTVSTTPFNDRFDSGIYGIICCEKDKAESDFNGDFTEDKIYEVLDAEVEEIKNALEGNVYGAICYLKCPHCGNKDRVLFAIGNYYPDMKDMFIEDLNNLLDNNGIWNRIKIEDVTYF